MLASALTSPLPQRLALICEPNDGGFTETQMIDGLFPNAASGLHANRRPLQTTRVKFRRLDVDFLRAFRRRVAISTATLERH